MATSMIPQMQGMISVERVRVAEAFAISGDTKILENASIAKTGYKVLGVAGIQTDAGASGTGLSYCFVYRTQYDVSAETVTVGIRNTRSSTSTIDVYAVVIYEEL